MERDAIREEAKRLDDLIELFYLVGMIPEVRRSILVQREMEEIARIEDDLDERAKVIEVELESLGKIVNRLSKVKGK